MEPYGGVKVELLSFLVEGDRFTTQSFHLEREVLVSIKVGHRAGLEAFGEDKHP
jgi:hypothetical protein